MKVEKLKIPVTMDYETPFTTILNYNLDSIICSASNDINPLEEEDI